MRLLRYNLMVGMLGACLAVSGCSKTDERPTPTAAEQPQVTAPAPKVETTAPSIANVEQVKASWESVSQRIANEDYDNAIRAWAQLEQAQRQSQMSEAVRAEYQTRLYQVQESLRQKAETDAKAREAYQKLGRMALGR